MRKLGLLVLIGLIFSCKQKIEKPQPFIEQTRMTDIMFDMALLYGIEGTSVYYTDTITKIDMQSILRKYEIDSMAFVDNTKYYIELEDGVFLKMQEEIIRRLESQKEVVDSLLNVKEGDLERGKKVKLLRQKLTEIREVSRDSVKQE